MSGEQRRLAAIVSADVAGYSRLMGRDESGTLAALKALRREIIDPRIKAHRGRLVKTTGDGLLLEFASVVDAMRSVVEIQAAMADHNRDVPPDQRIEFRVGVNIGDIIIDGDDIFGDGVNVAARLQELAAPGGICASGRVEDDVRGKLDIAFEDAGDQQLKNIARPVRVYQFRPGGAAPVATPHLALPDKPSIAVLPFQNMSGAGAYDPVLPDWSIWDSTAPERVDLLRFARAHRLAVIATSSPAGQPQTSVVRFVATDAFELIVDSHGAARKVRNLRSNPGVGVTIGWDDLQTLQIDGCGTIEQGTDLERAKSFYESQFPERYRARQAIEDLVYIKITPSWMRFSDFRRNPADVFTLDLATGRREHSTNVWRAGPA